MGKEERAGLSAVLLLLLFCARIYLFLEEKVDAPQTRLSTVYSTVHVRIASMQKEEERSDVCS